MRYVRHALPSAVPLLTACRRRVFRRQRLVLTCREALLHDYKKFGFVNEGMTEKSTHGGAKWYQMRLTFRDEGKMILSAESIVCDA